MYFVYNTPYPPVRVITGATPSALLLLLPTAVCLSPSKGPINGGADPERFCYETSITTRGDDFVLEPLLTYIK